MHGWSRIRRMWEDAAMPVETTDLPLSPPPEPVPPLRDGDRLTRAEFEPLGRHAAPQKG